MKRLTSKRTWDEAKDDLVHEMGYKYIWERLNEIENVLGDEYDIESVKLRTPTKVISRKWNPNQCPTCLANLGEKCNDGYWKNPHYEKCPVCGQLLEWEE